MKQILVICEVLNELARLRKYFDPAEYTVKAVTSYQAAVVNLRKDKSDLVIVDIGEKTDGLFGFYRFMRTGVSCADIPMIIMANPATQRALMDNTEMIGTRVVGSTINVENMQQTMLDALTGKDGKKS